MKDDNNISVMVGDVVQLLEDGGDDVMVVTHAGDSELAGVIVGERRVRPYGGAFRILSRGGDPLNGTRRRRLDVGDSVMLSPWEAPRLVHGIAADWVVVDGDDRRYEVVDLNELSRLPSEAFFRKPDTVTMTVTFDPLDPNAELKARLRRAGLGGILD